MAKMGLSVTDKHEAKKSENNQITRRLPAQRSAKAIILCGHVDVVLNLIFESGHQRSLRSLPQFPCHFSPCVLYVLEPAQLQSNYPVIVIVIRANPN
jgi:hypothetical protein